jgi:hypothetical protein
MESDRIGAGYAEPHHQSDRLQPISRARHQCWYCVGVSWPLLENHLIWKIVSSHSSLDTAPPNANTYSESCNEIGAMQYPSNLNISKYNYSEIDVPEMPYEKMSNCTYNYAAPQNFNPNITVETPLEGSGSRYNGDSLDFDDIMQDVTFGTGMSDFEASGFHGSANEGIEDRRWGN